MGGRVGIFGVNIIGLTFWWRYKNRSKSWEVDIIGPTFWWRYIDGSKSWDLRSGGGGSGGGYN
jgi:hypothetical protein